MGHPQPLFNLFVSFQTIITTNNSAKCPSSILYWDLNPQPLEHESPPITTRPGLPHYNIIILVNVFMQKNIRVSTFLIGLFAGFRLGRELHP